MQTLTDQNFEETIKNAKLPILVDIYTEWCPPCKILGPILDKLSEEYSNKVTFYKMNLDENSKTGEAFQIDRIPTVLLFVKGEAKANFVGLKQEEDIKNWINSNI
ncbi:MAG: thioredoxin [Candidatus Pacebacteria bacterium]|nr:thioredoxin [Candidatus Paceibacterota bacterium]